MLEKYLIDHCSPTLASLKTANMFSCPYESGESLEEDVRTWNLQMKDKGLYLTVLRKSDKKALVYLCRPQRLEQDLHKPGVQKFLRACGYQGEHWEEALKELKERLHMCEKFPHEIGLFLDYPLVDVSLWQCKRSRKNILQIQKMQRNLFPSVGKWQECFAADCSCLTIKTGGIP